MQVEQQRTSAWDIADILHPELFSANNNANPNPSPSTSFSSPSSRESTPMSQHLPTPPQQPPYPTFPSSSATASNPMDLSSESFFSFLDAGDMDGKGAATGATQHSNADPFNPGSNSFDYNFGFDYASMPMMMTSPMSTGGPQSASDYSMEMNAFMTGLGMGSTMEMGIDPQLVDSPAPLVSMGEDGDQEEEEELEQEEEEEEEEAPAVNTRSSNKKKDSPTESIASTRSKRGRKATISTNAQSRTSSSSPTATSPSTYQQESQKGDKLTLTIAPVKVGGRGGARRGTVQSGGITKKSAAPVPGANGPMYSGSVLKVVKEDAGKENNGAGAAPTKGRGRGRRGTTAIAPTAALPSPPSSHHDGEDMEEDMSAGAPGPTPGHRFNASISSMSGGSTSPISAIAAANASGGTILTGNALVANGRKTTPFDLGIDGLSISASFAIPPGTFNTTTPSAVGSSSGLGVPALVAANAAASGSSASPTSANGASRYATPALNFASGNGASHKVKERDQSVDPDGDDIPADWRPSPEMLAKMSSKEKRQLRNKISARNFRVRRKEYISTLELDIAERDRLLDAIRTELGTSRNENNALRQEIAALKKNLLEGRGLPTDIGYNLPPPAPLPEKSAAEVLMQQQQQQAAAAAATSAANLLKPNTQKDMHGNGQSAFWGGSASSPGAGFGGGFVPVHTTFVPSVASSFASMGGPYGTVGVGVGAGASKKPVLQENMNPLMRASVKVNQIEETRERERDAERKDMSKDGFEGFADLNMFTMKSMDAYRMHLWGKMAAQYHWHQKQQQHSLHPQPQPPSPQPNLFLQQQQQQQHISGLAAGLRPSYFTGVSSGVLSGKERVSSSPVLGNVTNTHPSSPKQEVYTPLLAALLHGKHGSKADSPPAGDVDSQKKQAQFQAELERKQQQMHQEQARAAVIAAVASQTMFKKLGQAFWDAFSGSSSNHSSGHRREDWDADKVRRVLEGKAVVRVVDVDAPEAKPQPVKDVKRNVSNGGSLSMPSSPLMRPTPAAEGKCGGNLCDSLEERMRSLALGPRAGKD